MVKFLWLKDKLAVLDKVKNLKGSGNFVSKDFPETVRQRRKELFPAMKAARERGDIAYLIYDKFIVCPITTKEGQNFELGSLVFTNMHLQFSNHLSIHLLYIILDIHYEFQLI